MPRRKTKRTLKLPRIGPCRDMLELWFLEFVQDGQVFRRYFADRPAARTALDAMRRDQMTDSQQRMLAAIERHAGADGWAAWVDVYNTWDPQNVPPQFAGQAAQKVWLALAKRGLVEERAGQVRKAVR
jgi:hypothetical protein